MSDPAYKYSSRYKDKKFSKLTVTQAKDRNIVGAIANLFGMSVQNLRKHRTTQIPGMLQGIFLARLAADRLAGEKVDGLFGIRPLQSSEDIDEMLSHSKFTDQELTAWAMTRVLQKWGNID